MKQFSFAIVIALIFSNITFAQKKTFEGVLEMTIKNSGTILKDNQVKGYYFFYKTDKVDRKTNSYLLQILDENLNEVKKYVMEDSKYLNLLEASYNDVSLAFQFTDLKKKVLLTRIFDTKGNLVTKKSRDLTKYELILYSASLSVGGSLLHAVPNKGFVIYNTDAEKIKNLSFNIQFIPEKGKKSWTYKPKTLSKGMLQAGFADATEDLLISIVTKRPSVRDVTMNFSLLGIDVNTGKALFDKKIEDSKYEVQPFNAYIDKDGSISVFGLYFNKGDKVVKAKSLGLFSYKLDNKGNILVKNYTSWSKDVSKFVDVDSRGKIKDVGYIYFHNMIKNKDGKIFAIGEQYRKALSIGGKLNGQGSAKIVTEDLAIFEFDASFKLNAVKFFDKTKTNVQMPEGTGLASPQMLAQLTKSYGGFDYAYTQEYTDGTKFTATYIDLKKEKGKNKEWIFGAVTYTNGKYTTDEISLETDASFIRTSQAKPGYVLILEYFKKDKRMELRLEKINF